MEYKNIKIVPGGSNKPPRPDAEAAGKPDLSAADPTHTLNLGTAEFDGSDMPAVMRPREGTKYRYIKTIGRGGMKVVLEVRDNDTMRNVAMALLPDISTRSKLEQGQFLREARITAGLEHPNIVPVHDIGIDSSGSPFFTMKLLRGRNLATVLKQLQANDPAYTERYTLVALLRIFTRICNAIAFAHSRGVLHLDLKPENVQIGDFGEVLVLDWGLAREITPGPAAGRINTKTRKMKRQDDGATGERVNGTPGYMAPEQITGSRHSCSPQTDIYSLGALLYAMITYQNPVQSKTVEQMLRDTVAGNIVRPSLRVEDREIPYGIEAVVLKAMSLNPEDRYATVRELRDEVVQFIAGFATQAENAGPLKKMMLFVRRHSRSVISGAVILLLLLLLGVFSWREANRIISLWVPVLSADFEKPDFPVDDVSFRGMNFQPLDRAWPLTERHGLSPEPDQWLLGGETFQENIKMTLQVQLPADRKFRELDLVLISAASAGPELSLKSPMVSCHLLGAPYYLAEILDCRNYQAPRILGSVKLPELNKEQLEVTAVHENGELSLSVNRKKILKVWTYRLLGNGPVYAGFRADVPGGWISSLTVSRLAPPENATALLAGDTLLEERLYEQAIRRYLLVDDNRPGSPLAEKALQKAYLATFKIDSDELRSEYSQDIKRRLAANYPKFNMAQLLSADVCTAWRNGEYEQACRLMEKVFLADPHTRVVQNVLALPHRPLPEPVQQKLLKFIRRSPSLRSLDLSGYGLNSLQGIAGLPLHSLNCSDNRLRSLNALKGMPLKSLNCAGNQIRSVAPLQGMPLRYLDCSDNLIRDFSPLKQMRLFRKNFSGNPARPTGKP